jgi:hypothetical protein
MHPRLIVPAVLAVLSLVLVSCSPVAWAPRETPQVSSISAGERVTLQLRDGSTLAGVVTSIGDLSATAYEGYYNERLKASTLPSIGDPVAYTTSLDENKVWTGTLAGFDESNLLVAVPGEPTPARVYFSSLGSLAGRDGRAIRRMELRGMYLNGEIPLMSAVVIRDAGSERQVPLNEIERIGLAPSADGSAAVTWLDARRVTWSRE